METKLVEIKTSKSLAEIFHDHHQETNAVFLDSSLQNEYGRFSIVGLCPYLIAEERNGKLYLNNLEQKESFTQWLKKYLRMNFEKNTTDLPLISGGIGYFTYDFGRKMVGIKSRHSSNLDIPDARLIFYSLLLMEDQEKKCIYAAIRTEKGAEKLTEILCNISKYSTPDSKKTQSSENSSRNTRTKIQFNFKKSKYLDAIRSIIDYIINGDIYIANMTQQLIIKSSKRPYTLFEILRKENPSPFGGYLNYKDFQVVCASPERFLKVRNQKIETRPIKGTRKRGVTKAEDIMLRKELECSEKDKSELLMIVDLERNDLNRICNPNTVKVTELYKIETYATVFHLVSTIQGVLRNNTDFVDILNAAFPGGSITGAPKHRAMEIIDELEQTQRGLYTGSIGYIAFDGACDLNIVIRTALHQNGEYHLGVGGGITYESDFTFEYEETLQKAKAFLNAMEEK